MKILQVLKYKFCLFAACFLLVQTCFLTAVFAQENETIEVKKFDAEKWQKATKNIDYNEEIEKPKKKKKREYRFPALDGLGDIFSIVAIVIAVILLGYLLFLFVEKFLVRANKNVKPKDIDIEKLEENIHEIDLYKLLEETLQKKDYKLAVRIYYLIVIKALSEQKFIKWKKQKTNGEYVSEMFGQKLFQPFQKATYIFDSVWYGENTPNESNFQSIEKNFLAILSQLKPVVKDEK